MIDPVEAGKNAVEELIGEEARKAGIKTAIGPFIWWSDTPPSYWRAEVRSLSGKIAEQRFSLEQLTGFTTDNEQKMQVAAKVASIIAQLLKLDTL